MCIVIAKPEKVQLPTEDTLETCFFNNPDGAGYMFTRDRRVHIRKGFFDLDDMLKSLKTDDLSPDMSIVYHFRIMTAGKLDAANCHPFPLSRDPKLLKAKKTTCTAAMAHNGIISIEHKPQESDTAAFVRKILADPIIKNNLKNAAVQALIADYTKGSKIAILDSTGKIMLIGKNWTKDGCIYSNNTYKWIYKYPTYSYYGETLKTWGKKEKNPLCQYCQQPTIHIALNKYYCARCKVDFLHTTDTMRDIDTMYLSEYSCENCTDPLYSLDEYPNFLYCENCDLWYMEHDDGNIEPLPEDITPEDLDPIPFDERITDNE